MSGWVCDRHMEEGQCPPALGCRSPTIPPLHTPGMASRVFDSQQGRWSPTLRIDCTNRSRPISLDTQKWRDWSQKLGSPHTAYPSEPVPHSHGSAGHMIFLSSMEANSRPTEGQTSSAVWPSAGGWVAAVCLLGPQVRDLSYAVCRLHTH